jgi:hypothetical protein
MTSDDLIRQQFIGLLNGAQAHMTFDMIVADMPLATANAKAPHFPYTPWHLVEHMRIAQHDILQFVLDPAYRSPSWPEEFWPAEDTVVDRAGWDQSLALFRQDFEQVQNLIRDPETDFFAPIPHAPDYILFRQILLIADHNAYHLGELITLRQVLAAPPPDKW